MAVYYEEKTILPMEKTEIKRKEMSLWFNVIDEYNKEYVCFKTYLYDGIRVGESITVGVSKKRPQVILRLISSSRMDDPFKWKAPPNETEAECYKLLKDAGWEVTKKGWPDFACFKDGQLVLVEVKPRRSERLKYWQHKIMAELVKHGIDCYRWSPDGGFEPLLQSRNIPLAHPPAPSPPIDVYKDT